MRSLKYKLLCLVLLSFSGCASAPRTFAPMTTCLGSASGDRVCVDEIGKPTATPQQLICFKADEFKVFNESCHKP